MIYSDLYVILPEILLSVFALVALIAVVYAGKDQRASLLLWVSTGMLLAVTAFIGIVGSGTHVAFNSLFVDDAFSRFAKILILASAAVILLMSESFMAKHDLLRFEYPILIVLAAVGMMIMVSAADLMTLYMGLELQSLSLYIVAALRRDSVRATEAGLKYFVLGALSSGLFLFGASLVYGYAGTTQFAGIIETTRDQELSLGLLFGLIFVISGLAFKVSAVPFHMWTPDVYEGSPTPVTAFFSTAPKVAAIGLFARVLHDAFGGAIADWRQVIALLSVLSMFLGSIAAIGQTDIKRLMAYSSIAHMGYALMGLAAGTQLGIEALLVYMVIYVTMSIGTFAFILTMERDGQPITDISALKLIANSDPLKALSMLILLFSLAGVPPMLGFFGKFYVLKSAYEAGLIWLAIAGVVASVIGAYYYLRIVFLMYFGDDVNEELETRGTPILTAIVVVCAAVMVLGIVNLFGIDGAASVAAEILIR
ncbi:MAG: NADH-quinone oxidoreductase subunit NuoN [Aestuariivita sp.]|nr:NADH-quinone oxidoreductase subunit NuoN [Aestuariivita sp.]